METQTLEEWDVRMVPVFNGQLRPRSKEVSSPNCWLIPPEGWLKLNFDGASKGNLGPTGFGGVIHNLQGIILWAYWGQLGWDINNVAELEGMIHGLMLLEHHAMSPTIIEGDSKIIIDMARKLQTGNQVGHVTKTWWLEFRVERLTGLLRRLPNCSLSHVRRKVNGMVDLLANKGVMVVDTYVDTRWPPIHMKEWATHVEKIARKDLTFGHGDPYLAGGERSTPAPLS